MIKNTMILRKGRIEYMYLYTFSISLLFGLCVNPIVFAFVLLHLYITHKKGYLSYLSFCIPLCLLSLNQNIQYTYIYLGFSVAIFLIMKLYEKCDIDIIKEMPYWSSAIVLMATYYLSNDVKSTLLVGLTCFVVHYFYLRTQDLEKQNTMNAMMILSYLTAAYFLLGSLFPMYIQYFSLFYLCVIAYTIPFNLCIFIFLYFSFQSVHFYYLLYLLYINYNNGKRMFISFFGWGSLALSFSMYNIVFSLACSVLGMLSYKENNRFMSETYDVEKSHQLYMQHTFYKQLMNYSSVFYDLSKYYEDLNNEQSQMLNLMGDALEYNAKVSKQYFYMKEEKVERIKQILKGYHFSLLDCEYEENDNKVTIHLNIMNLYKDELEEIIIPLLEKISQSRLKIAQVNPYAFQKEKLKITLESCDYLNISTYGDSIHVRDLSGDSFHTFQMEQNVICMLSDGMGQGMKAKKISSLLIQVMEAMMRCDIPQVECIKMINRFMRSDIYATLDVLSFDRKRNKAYLSKSASAPTYLFRDDVLYEMNGHSLPIGIVDNIQADVFEIAFQKEDIFIMISDGVVKEEIEKWHSLRRCPQIKNEGLNLMNIIKEKKRNDDSTLLMAKIS